MLNVSHPFWDPGTKKCYTYIKFYQKKLVCHRSQSARVPCFDWCGIQEGNVKLILNFPKSHIAQGTPIALRSSKAKFNGKLHQFQEENVMMIYSSQWIKLPETSNLMLVEQPISDASFQLQNIVNPKSQDLPTSTFFSFFNEKYH